MNRSNVEGIINQSLIINIETIEILEITRLPEGSLFFSVPCNHICGTNLLYK